MNNTIKRRIRANKIGRNDPCPCGSGKKYKKCCNNGIKPVERWDKIKNKNRKEWASCEISHSELIDIAKKYGCNCHNQTIIVGWLDCMDCKKPCAGITDFIGKDGVVCPICGSNDVQVRMTALCTIPTGFKSNCLYACSKCGNIELDLGDNSPHCGICEHGFTETDKIQLRIDDPISDDDHINTKINSMVDQRKILGELTQNNTEEELTRWMSEVESKGEKNYSEWLSKEIENYLNSNMKTLVSLPKDEARMMVRQLERDIESKYRIPKGIVKFDDPPWLDCDKNCKNCDYSSKTNESACCQPWKIDDNK